MRARWIFVVAIAVSVVLAMGCGDPPPGAAGESLEISEPDRSPPTAPTAGTEARLGNLFADMIDAFGAQSDLYCECFYEDEGFDSRQECVEMIPGGESDTDALSSCIAEAASDVDESPPSSVGDLLDCAEGALSDYDQCVSGVQSQHSHCSEEHFIGLEVCEEELDDELLVCEDKPDEEGGAWLEALNVELEQRGCLDDYGTW